MNTINQRFTELISGLKMNTNSFAKSIGKSYTSIESICKGKAKPGFELLETILDAYPNVSADWLMKGEGEMFAGRAKEPSVDLPADYLLNYLKMLEEKFGSVANQLAVKDRQMEGMQRTIDALLGKHKGAMLKTHPSAAGFRLGHLAEQRA